MRARFAGCDLGQSSLGWAVVAAGDGGTRVLEGAGSVDHGGRPLEAFARWYREQGIARCQSLGVTGLHAGDLGAPATILPEDGCQEAALALAGLPAAVNLVSIGGRGYRVLARQPAPGGGPGAWDVRYLENEKCSSGTGENMRKIAARFGLSLAEADARALAAPVGTPITARCAVFTKSEMTHYANEGRPHGELFRGYFDSVARNALGLLVRARVPGPVYLIGGGARLEALRRALAELLGEAVLRPDHFTCFEAVGAALLGGEAVPAGAAALPADPAALARPRATPFSVLPPAATCRDRVTRLGPVATGEDWRAVPTLLGLDLGSTGAKAALCSLVTGAPLRDVYDTTRGDPVGATQRLVGALLAGGAADVRAVGVTGSGRQAVATVLRAAFPEAAARVFVANEIVAHATAAIRCDPAHGADLSVVEIGGQDAKYIRVSGGRIVESDLNQACSAGTGSFLAEQAALYEVTDLAEVTRLAAAARRPPDLGQMCTVYVADAAARARDQGFELGDLFAGFQYSVVHNYLHRVMGQRTLAGRVFFQGKPAENLSLAWTLAAVAERDITVPANPGAMGAWGIGLCALAQLGADALASSPSLDLARLGEARIEERGQLVCRDESCATLCAIDRTVVRLGERRETTFSGGACPKFELSTRDQPKLPRDAPDPFEQRAALVAACARPAGPAGVVAIPVVGALAGHVPWLATLAAELGFGVRLLHPEPRALAAGEQLTPSFDSCGPTKVTLAVCDVDAPLLLFPRLLELFGDGHVDSCVTEQAHPDIVAASLRARGRTTRVIRPLLELGGGPGAAGRARGAAAVAAALGADAARVPRALVAADRAQVGFARALASMGEAALAWARARGVPAVLCCGSLHVLHDRSLNAGIPGLLRRNGALAIPVDAFPVPPSTPPMTKIYWGESNRTLRAAAAARARGDVFPLLLASFGCGPASFVEQVFQELLHGYPHAVLENDGHGGAAGFVTRIQAFLTSVRQHGDEGAVPSPADEQALALVEPTPRRGPYLDRAVRYVFMSGTDYLGDVFAAVYRAHGYDAVTAPPLSEETAACGRRDCSGKECLSYQLLWGAFRRWLEANPTDREVRLVQISGRMCRAGAFPLKDRISLSRLGLDDHVGVTALRTAGGPAMTARVWLGLVAVDLLRQLYLYHLAVEREAGEAERLYRGHAGAVLALLAAPAGRGPVGPALLARVWRRLVARVDRAAADFAALEARRDAATPLPTVFLSGDILTKGNDFAGGGLCQELSRRGVRVIFEPTCDFLEHLAEVHPVLLFGQGVTARSHLPYRLSMVAIRDALYARVKARHPFLPLPELARVLARTDELMARRTIGGSALTVGSALHHYESGAADGVVLAACWGCDNGVIAENLLRQRRELPALFYYDDGAPLDERRLDRFVFQLRRRMAQGAARTAAAARPGIERRALRRLGRLAHVLGASAAPP